MKHYLTRRERWLQALIGCDEKVHFTDEMLGERILNNAGITDMDKRLILTFTGNETSQKKGERRFDSAT